MILELERTLLTGQSQVDQQPPHIGLRGVDTLCDHRLPCCLGELGKTSIQLSLDLCQRFEHLALRDAFDSRSSQPDRTQQTRVLRNQYLVDAQKTTQGACMLATGAAEGHQHIVRWTIALPDRDPSDGFGHPFIRDLEQSDQHAIEVQGARPLALGNRHLQTLGSPPGGTDVDRNLEALTIESSEQEIDIRDRQRTACTVAGRSRRGASTLRSDLELVTVQMNRSILLRQLPSRSPGRG